MKSNQNQAKFIFTDFIKKFVNLQFDPQTNF